MGAAGSGRRTMSLWQRVAATAAPAAAFVSTASPAACRRMHGDRIELQQLCDAPGAVLAMFAADVRCGGGAAELGPVYEQLCEELGWPVDSGRLQKLRAANAAKLKELEAKIADAEENLGDVEVREARAAKADYLCITGAPPLEPQQAHVR